MQKGGQADRLARQWEASPYSVSELYYYGNEFERYFFKYFSTKKICPLCILRYMDCQIIDMYSEPIDVLKEMLEKVALRATGENLKFDVTPSQCLCCCGTLETVINPKWQEEIWKPVIDQRYNPETFFLAITVSDTISLYEELHMNIVDAFKIPEIKKIPKDDENKDTEQEKEEFDQEDFIKSFKPLPLKVAMKYILGPKTRAAFGGIPVDTKSDMRIDLTFLTKEEYEIEIKNKDQIDSCETKGQSKRMRHKQHSYRINEDADFSVVPEIKYMIVPKRVTNVYIKGLYNKYMRGVSQTFWYALHLSNVNHNKERENEELDECDLDLSVCPYKGSLEEFIAFPMGVLFNATKCKFHAGGREDMDVRMLGTGRDFVVELEGARRLKLNGDKEDKDKRYENFDEFVNDMDKLTELCGLSGKTECKNLVQSEEIEKIRDKIISHITLEDLSKYLTLKHSDCVKVSSLEYGDKDSVLNLTDTAENKVKYYDALCKSDIPISESIIKAFNEKYDKPVDKDNPLITLEQKTPLRVLHRRVLMTREKNIYSVKLSYYDEHHFIASIACQSGTYVKEFIHGDFGRTKPAIFELINSLDEMRRGDDICYTDILQLDVTGIETEK